MNTYQIPTYEKVSEALKSGDNDTIKSAVFSFEIDDLYYVDQVTKAVRSLLDRPSISPDQVTSIKKALLGLSRLPLRTAGLEVEISLVNKLNNAASSYIFFISSDRFATDSGGYDNFGFGTDSFSGASFEVGPSYNEISGYYDTWVDVFREMTAAELIIHDESDDSLLDWDHPDGTAFWEWIDNHSNQC
jgi:hypothetical protein